MEKEVAKNVDEYIAKYSSEIQAKLLQMRSIIREIVPNAQEKISWGMPTYYDGGNIVYFAANKAHIGFYIGSETALFKDKLSQYKTTVGGVQFPYSKELPKELIQEMVKLRVQSIAKNFECM